MRRSPRRIRRSPRRIPRRSEFCIGCVTVGVAFRNIQRGDAARVGHHVLHLPRTPDREQSRLAVAVRHGTETPERIVEAVAVKDDAQRQRFVVRLGFVQMPQQF
jgi:hypothetical protein